MRFLPFLPFLLLTVCLSARMAAAHPNGASRIDVVLKGDSAEATIAVKPDDILYVVQAGYLPELTKSKVEEISDKIAYYMESRFEFKVDGRSAPVRVLQYSRKGNDPLRKLDSADYYDSSLALRFGYSLPAAAKKLEIDSKLLAELEVQPLCHLRVLYQGQEIRHKFLGLDDQFSMSLDKDSLEAMLAAAKQPAPSPGQAAPPPNKANEESVVGRFLWLGFTHILPEGTDHILFVLGLFFFSTFFRPLLIQITAFTIAHSITLGLSLFGVFSLSPRIVEPLIALSIAVVAVENIFFRKLRPSRFLIVFGFGLIHGLGFAGVLKSLGLPENQFLKVLVSFNLGVEGGQLAVVGMAAALTAWMWKKPWYFKRVVVPVSALIAAVGLFWFVQRIVHPGS
jgi:hypothetical protein